VGGHVLDPVHHFLWRSAADVAVDVRVRSEHLAKIEKLVRAKRIRVHASPTVVWPSRAFVAWSNAVAPVILIGEAATGPAQDGDMKFLQRRHRIVTQPTRVRDRRILTDPKPLINQPPKMLGKLPIDV